MGRVDLKKRGKMGGFSKIIFFQEGSVWASLVFWPKIFEIYIKSPPL